MCCLFFYLFTQMYIINIDQNEETKKQDDLVREMFLEAGSRSDRVQWSLRVEIDEQRFPLLFEQNLETNKESNRI